MSRQSMTESSNAGNRAMSRTLQLKKLTGGVEQRRLSDWPARTALRQTISTAGQTCPMNAAIIQLARG